MSESDPLEQGDAHLSLLEHLHELRRRLTWAALALAVATVICFLFAETILEFLLTPYSASIGTEATLQTLKPTEGLETYFKVALVAGAIIAMPIILIQFWLFVSPVVYPSSLIPEKWRAFYGLNPMAGVIEGFRWALLGKGEPPGPMLAVSVFMVFFVLFSGIIYFKKMEGTVADVI